MNRVIIDGGKEDIMVLGDQSVDRALEAHGHDPASVEYTVEKGVEERVKDLEAATGRNGEGERGIANRIDDLEDRVAALEQRLE